MCTPPPLSISPLAARLGLLALGRTDLRCIIDVTVHRLKARLLRRIVVKSYKAPLLPLYWCLLSRWGRGRDTRAKCEICYEYAYIPRVNSRSLSPIGEKLHSQDPKVAQLLKYKA
ncbi:hypothetical protein HOY80DRAFT_1001733 [Tuber brumale]|nr:hypothetical protein HOY80DRAFT_1001733 [Tuber brumale]